MNLRAASMLAASFALLLLAALARSSTVEEHATRVAVIELDSTPPGYAVVIAGTRHRGILDMLNSLAADYEQGDQLAVLFAPNVPIEAVATLASMASKVGYFGDTLKLFVMDYKREGIAEVSLDKNWLGFTADPQTLARRFHSQ